MVRLNLINARKAKGLTLGALGELVGLTDKAIWAIEHCLSDGRMRSWDRLEMALGVDQKTLRQIYKENS